MSFRTLSIATAAICLALAAVWMFAPGLLLDVWGVLPGDNEAIGLTGRRMAALFAGFGVMFYRARNAEPSIARAALSSGIVVACLALAALGLYELASGRAGVGILSAAAVEAALALGFLTARC